jgi:quercetin dioxygenase-like cupin family protein
MKPILPHDHDPIEAEGYTKHLLLDAQALNCPGALVQIVTIQPGGAVADHYHRAAREFYYVLQGRCRLTVNGETSTLRPGDMLLMEPGDVHSLANHGAIPFQLLVFKTNAADDTYWQP